MIIILVSVCGRKCGVIVVMVVVMIHHRSVCTDSMCVSFSPVCLLPCAAACDDDTKSEIVVPVYGYNYHNEPEIKGVDREGKEKKVRFK